MSILNAKIFATTINFLARFRRTNSPTYRIGLLLLSFVLFLSALSRTNGMDPESGDIGVWLNIQEWMSRENKIYLGVWDHKDWGFYQVLRLFYLIGGIPGVYISGLIATSLFSFGIYLLTREVSDRRTSSILALSGGISYVLSPSYFATYTENYSIAVVILAAGLLRRRPVVSGILFSIAASLKLSTLPTWISVIAAIAITYFFSRDATKRLEARQTVLRSCLGFSVGLFFIIFSSALDKSLQGWIDVISYNRQYSLIRRDGNSMWSSFILRDPASTLFIISLFAAVVVAMIFMVIRLITHPPCNDEEVNGRREVRTLILVASLLLGSFLALVVQAPPAPQYLQFLVGPLIALVCVVTGISCNGVLFTNRRFMKALIVLLPVGATFLSTPQALSRQEIQNGLSKWAQLSEPGPLSQTLKFLPPQSSIAFLGGNSPRPDIRALPTTTTLACRFVYQFSHLFPEYQKEIETCLQSRPDFLVLQTSSNWGTGAFQENVQVVIKLFYHQCVTDSNELSLWSTQESKCPILNS